MCLVRHQPQPKPSFRGALVSQSIIDKWSVLRSSLVGIAPREFGSPILALYGFPTLGSIHLASTTPSPLASCYTTIATSPLPMHAVFHPVEKETEISIRRSSRVALRGLIGTTLARCGEAAHTFFRYASTPTSVAPMLSSARSWDTTVIAAGSTESLSGAVERGTERHARSEVRDFDRRKGTVGL